MMGNLAQDWVAWVWVVKAAVIVALLIWIFYDAMEYARTKETMAKQKHRIIWRIGVKFACVLLIVLALFVFFGPGTLDTTRAIEDDGHHQMVIAREVPSESEIREEAKAKKDPYLKAVDEGPEKDRKAADDYIKKALERSKNK